MVFSTKKGLLECKPEWNREAITVFSRLPSLRRLQATPPLQTSLTFTSSAEQEEAVSSEQTSKVLVQLLQALTEIKALEKQDTNTQGKKI